MNGLWCRVLALVLEGVEHLPLWSSLIEPQTINITQVLERKMKNTFYSLIGLCLVVILSGRALSQAPPAVPVAPTSPVCLTGNILSNNDNIGNGHSRRFEQNGNRSNVNLNGGQLTVCGDLVINSGNFNGGSIFVLPGGRLTINSSVSVLNINLINEGVLDLRANNMNFNSNSRIWNLGDSMIVSGNGTHNMNGVMVTGNGSTTRVEASSQINGSGVFHVDNNSTMIVEGNISNNGNIVVWEFATLQLEGSYSSNSGARIFMDDFALMTIDGAAVLNHPVIYIGDQGNGAMMELNGSTAFNNPASSFSELQICSPQTFSGTELGSAQQSCTSQSSFGAGGVGPLPVSLVSLTAERTSDGALIRWETAAEINNAFFLIQKSSNMADWEDAGMVEGLGTSSVGKTYSFTDAQPQTYYRLMQVDFDGTSEIFGPIALGESFEIANPVVTRSGQYFRIQAKGLFSYQYANLTGQVFAQGESEDGVLIPIQSSGFAFFQVIQAGKSYTFSFFVP